MEKLGMSLDAIISSKSKESRAAKKDSVSKALTGPKAKKVAVQKDKLAVAAAAASKKRTAKAAAIRQSVATAGTPQPPAKGSSAPKPRPGSGPKPRVVAAQKKGNAVAAAGKRRNSGAPGPGRTIVPRKAPFLGAGSSAPPLGLKITIKNDLFRPSGSAPGNRGQARGGKVRRRMGPGG